LYLRSPASNAGQRVNPALRHLLRAASDAG
jgi:hypothetical protein